jgi:hypothetical protein
MHSFIVVEMFKVRMQGQYGAATDKRLSVVAREMWQQWGFRKGVMRGYWVTVMREIPAYAGCVLSLFLRVLPLRASTLVPPPVSISLFNARTPLPPPLPLAVIHASCRSVLFTYLPSCTLFCWHIGSIWRLTDPILLLGSTPHTNSPNVSSRSGMGRRYRCGRC